MTRKSVNIHLEGGNKDIRITLYFDLDTTLACIFDDIGEQMKHHYASGVVLKSIYFSEEEVK
jgi:hypothetical protein